MKRVLRPMPVVFACRGCEHDGAARLAAQSLDRRGLAEASLAGSDADKARARFPIHVIEGCDKCCATQWLAGLGVRPRRTYLLDAAGGLVEKSSTSSST